MHIGLAKTPRAEGIEGHLVALSVIIFLYSRSVSGPSHLQLKESNDYVCFARSGNKPRWHVERRNASHSCVTCGLTPAYKLTETRHHYSTNLPQ